MVVDGVELLRMIRDGELKNEDRIKDLKASKIYLLKDDYIIEEEEYKKDYYDRLSDNYTFIQLSKIKFEILSEEDKEIDIQALQETIIGDFYDADGNIDVEEISNIFNDIIKALKQLDKQLNEPITIAKE